MTEWDRHRYIQFISIRIMNDSHQPHDVIHKLVQWAEQRDSIRAMLLTSTRAIPNAQLDIFSDYDVVLVVEDIHPFFEDRSWLEDFGKVLVAYWDPIYRDPDYGIEKFGNVTEYADELKIDFTILPVEWLQKIVQAPGFQPSWMQDIACSSTRMT